MPYPHVDHTIEALTKPWFFGDQRGSTYGGILRTKFEAAANKASIDSALALGNYLIHIESQKNKRHALRAVLLGNFLMKGFPVQQHQQLRQRCDSLSLEELKKEFAFLFPALLDNDKRSLWHPAYFTDPDNLAALKRSNDWRKGGIPRYRFIVHTLREPEARRSIFRNPIFELSKYEVLSMSIMSNEHPYSHSLQGLILRVPMNNILITSPMDVAISNYAPSVHGQAANPGARVCADEIIRIAAEQGGLRAPNDVIANSGQFHYNEIVVCGKAGIPLPHGTTESLTLVGVFVATDMTGTMKVLPALRDQYMRIVEDSALNNNVPLLYLPKMV
jgi:hypothetical protein